MGKNKYEKIDEMHYIFDSVFCFGGFSPLVLLFPSFIFSGDMHASNYNKNVPSSSNQL